MTGTTGKSVEVPDEVLEYMDRVKRCSKVPVCAGFGISSRAQVARFADHVDGVVIGSALVETLERGEDVRAFLGSLPMRNAIYRAASLLQVAHARNVLIAAGIRCEMRNLYLAGATGDLPMMETWPQLYVEEADERYALSILASASSASAGAPWICEECGEEPRAAVHLMLAMRPRAGRGRRAVSGPAAGRAPTGPADGIGCASPPGRLGPSPRIPLSPEGDVPASIA